MKEYDKDGVLYREGGGPGCKSIIKYVYDVLDHLHWMIRERGYERMNSELGLYT
jgi:hypothetical protein